jgi:HSP20 family molecular chaperone IbpA
MFRQYDCLWNLKNLPDPNDAIKAIQDGYGLYEVLNDKSFWTDCFYKSNGVKQTETGYELSLDLPGFKKDEVTVGVREMEILSIRAKSKKKGDITREYSIDKADFKKAEVKLEDGVLSVVIPFKEEMKPFSIEVK